MCRGITVAYFSKGGKYFGRLMSTDHINVQRQRKQSALYDTDFAMKLGQKILSAKVKNQSVVLHRYEKSREILLDEGKELVLYARSMRGGETSSYTIVLKGLPERPVKTTRLRISLAYQSAKVCKVTVKDMGFGEFFPSSGLIWESMLDME